MHDSVSPWQMTRLDVSKEIFFFFLNKDGDERRYILLYLVWCGSLWMKRPTIRFVPRHVLVCVFPFLVCIIR